MTTYTWTGAAQDDNFNNPANWSPRHVPSSADTVTINPAAALTLNVSATLANLITGADVTLTVNDNQTLQIGNGAATAKLTNGGTIQLNSGRAIAMVLDATTTTLSGGGTIEIMNRAIQASVAGQALENVNNTIAGFGALGNGTLTFVNGAAGVVDANQSGATLDINTGTIAAVNGGLLEAAAGGNLQIDSSVNNAIKGAIDANAGTVAFTNGKISGGTLAARDGGMFYDSGNVTLSALTLNGNLQVTDNADLTLLGSITNTGTLSENSRGTAIFVGPATGDGTVTLTGGGTMSLLNGLQASGAKDLLINVNNTIGGNANLGNGTALAIINQAAGTIDANNTALTVNIATSSLTNHGLVEATNGGALYLDSAVINAGTGNIAAAGGNVFLQDGSSVLGGTLSTSGGGKVIVTSGATLSVLNGVTNTGTVQIADYATAVLLGTITNIGTIAEAYVHSTGLLVGPATGAAGTVTLTGGGTVTLASSLQASQSGETLDNINNTINGYDLLGAGTNLAIINEAAGIIDSTAGITLNTGTATLLNHGLIEATTGGTLQIASAISNLGTGYIKAAGSDIYFTDGSSVSGGTLASSGGAEIIIASGGNPTVLDGTSGLTNTGTIRIVDYSSAILLGTIANLGTITESYVHDAGLLIGPATGSIGTVTLTGGGTVTLASSLQASQSGETLVNVNNTIDVVGNFNGEGLLGAGTNLAIINQAAGIIDANDGLTINTGSITLQNAGLIEASVAGTNVGSINIQTAIDNGASGQIDADGANIYLSLAAAISGGTLTGSGTGRFVIDGINNNALAILDGTTHAITNDAYIEVTDYDGLLIEGTFINNGTIHNDYVHGAGIVVGKNTVFTNNGTLQANQLNTTFGVGTKLTNDVSGTLTGGTYQASNATLSFSAPVVTTLSAGTVLDESNGAILFNGHDIFATLHTVQAGATLVIENGSYTGSQSLTNAGTLQLNGATYGVGKLVNQAGAAITGNGTIAASLTNSGLIDSTTGELDLTGSANSLGGTIAAAAGNFVGLGHSGGTTTLLAGAVVTASDLAVLYNSTLHLDAKLSFAGTLQLNGMVAVTGAALALSGLLHQRSDGSGQGTLASALTSTGTIQIDQGGTLSLTGGLANSGLILANGGLIDSHALTGGTLSIGASGLASLATAASAASTLAVLDTAGGALATNGTLTVTGDYNNTAAGTGNAYTPFAGITGTIDGQGAKLAIVGVQGTTITLVNGVKTITIASGGTAHFEIFNTGAAGSAALRGALETSVNGGSITGTALSGSGVTAGNFGAIAAGGHSGIYAIAYAGGPISGEAIHLASDFANVAGLTVDIVAKTAPATQSTLSAGQLHVASMPDPLVWHHFS